MLVPDDAPDELVEAIRGACSDTVTPFTPQHNSRRGKSDSRTVLLSHFQTQTLRGFGCEEFTAGLDACALVLHYLHETQVNALPHIRSLSTYSAREFMMLDATIVRAHQHSAGAQKKTAKTKPSAARAAD